LEEVSPSGCKGGLEEVRSVWIFILAQIVLVKDEICVARSCLTVSIFVSMEECMFLFMVEILALSCLTSCWVSVKVEDNELKHASKS
jgi:hypothetical protein